MSLVGKALNYMLFGALIVIGAFAVRHFWPRIETKTETVVVVDSAEVHIQAIRIDSLKAAIDSLKLSRAALEKRYGKTLAQTVTFYEGIIAELEAQGDSVTIPKAYAEQNFSAAAQVRAKWPESDGSYLVRDTTIQIYGTTHAQYAFPPVNQFTLLTELNTIEIPIPVVTRETVRTESRVSWEWTVAGIAVGVAAGVLLTRK